MYTLYSRPGTAGFAVEALLAEIGATVELIDIMESTGSKTPAAFRAINPLGQVPVLVLDDGTVMTESAAIMIYLADAHPEAHLAPGPTEAGRATYLRWLVGLATNLYISFRHVYHADSYAPEEQAAAVSAMGRRSVMEDFRRIEEAIGSGPFVLGERFTAADLYVAMFADWHWDRDGLLESLPRLSRLREHVLSRPAVATVADRHKG